MKIRDGEEGPGVNMGNTKIMVSGINLDFLKESGKVATLAMKVDTLNHLWRNNRAMIRWICNVKAKDEVSSDSLLSKLASRTWMWFGHIERSTGWIAEVGKLNVVASRTQYMSW